MKKALLFPLQISLCTFGCLCTSIAAVKAQITPDGTTSTTVNSDSNGNLTIEQGDRAGDNLFHSFGDFSVPTDGSAFFNNAADISNIFNRVTGGNPSSIDGLIGANGTANLFLINPAGILFGNNARLDIGGSFFGTTADSILFEDGEFSGTNLDNPPLLTINAPIGLNLRDNPGEIINRSTADDVGLQVATGKSISLIGGDVNLEGGLITVPEGRIGLGGLSDAGTIEIAELDNGFSFSFPEGVTRSNVTLSNGAEINVIGAGGGFINVNANNLTVSGASNFFAGIAEELGSPEARAGDINLNATGNINLSQESTIRNQIAEGATGTSGNINIEAFSVDVSSGSFISASTRGIGDAGNITINADNSVSLEWRKSRAKRRWNF